MKTEYLQSMKNYHLAHTVLASMISKAGWLNKLHSERMCEILSSMDFYFKLGLH